jgi:hypothetical protein
MTENILTASGIPYKRARFLSPPAETYAVYFDELTTDGPDLMAAGTSQIVNHAVMVELYEPTLDRDAEARLEEQLIAAGIHWTKQAAYWLHNVQRYQVIYEFEYTEKRRT